MPSARAPPVHVRHRPETTALYALVREHLGAFLELAAARYARPLPRYVARACSAYLDCGLLERGFLRVRCEACRKDRLVAFSCKQRGPCPSCAARVMCNSAADLTDRVLPNVPIRQWVLSLPFALRVAAARDPRLVAAIDRILFDAIQRRARAQLGLSRGQAGRDCDRSRSGRGRRRGRRRSAGRRERPSTASLSSRGAPAPSFGDYASRHALTDEVRRPRVEPSSVRSCVRRRER